MAIKKLKDFTNANNEILVDAAIKDSKGRNIAETYATKEEASQGGGNDLLSSNNTWTGNNTFKEIDIPISADGTTKVAKITQVDNYYLAIKVNNENFALFDLASNAISFTNIFPQGVRDIGSSSAKWRDLYLTGKIKDGTNEFNYDTIGLKTFDSSSPTLTDAMIDALKTSGVILRGDFTYSNITYHNPILFKSQYTGSGDLWGIGICYTSSQEHSIVFQYRISQTSKSFGVSSYNWLELQNIGVLNGKQIPNYPTANASPQFLQIGANGGNIRWVNVDYCNITVRLEANSGSNSGNTITFTFVGKKSIYENYGAADFLSTIYNDGSNYDFFATPFTDSAMSEFLQFYDILKNGTVYEIQLVDASQNMYNYKFDTDNTIIFTLSFWG